MKQIFINESPVPSITMHIAEQRDPSRLCHLFPDRKYEKPLMLTRALRGTANRDRIVSISDVKIAPSSFTYEVRADGVHLYVPALLAELGKFSGRTYKDWAAFRSGAIQATGSHSKPFYCTGDAIVMISKEELLKEWSMANDQTKAMAMMLLTANRLHGQENETLTHPTAVNGGAKVIDFQMARASQF